MGSWGYKIHQNDIALDVKEEYTALLKMGKSDEDALLSTLESLRDFADNSDDKYDYWFSLADLLFDYGRLTEEVKGHAISLIDEGGDLDRWDDRTKEKRRVVLEELRKKLSSEQPDRKVVKPIKKFTTSFKPDEIYYFQINDEQYKDRYYYNYYVIILVDRTVESDIRLSGLRDEYPLVYFKVCKNLPASIEEVDGIPMALVMYSGPKGDIIDGYLSEDHRVMMCKDGYRTMKKQLHFWGAYNFKREGNPEMLYNFYGRNYVSVWKENGMWKGHFLSWDTMMFYVSTSLGLLEERYEQED
ncbi:MAG: hypothetical protein IJL60_09375 [Clostridiales bacterium]|nr:hypothetical protein [Clostridiales bacterium]